MPSAGTGDRGRRDRRRRGAARLAALGAQGPGSAHASDVREAPVHERYRAADRRRRTDALWFRSLRRRLAGRASSRARTDDRRQEAAAPPQVASGRGRPGRDAAGWPGFAPRE
jgi:hypothetical protein